MKAIRRGMVGLTLLAVLGAPPAQGASRVGLLPLERVGDADPAYDSLELGLHRQVAALSSLPATDVVLPAGCVATDRACVGKAGQASGADLVLASSVERFPDGYVLRLRAIPVGTGDVKEQKRLVQGGSPDLQSAAESATCGLLSIEHCEGSLRFSAAAGTHLVLDGKDVGAVPFNGPVSIGRHSLRASVEGKTSDEVWIAVSWKQELAYQVNDNAGTLGIEKGDFVPPAVVAPTSPVVVEAPAVVAVPPPPPVVAARPPAVVVAPPPAVVVAPPAPEVVAPPPPPVVVETVPPVAVKPTEDLPWPTATEASTPPAPAPVPPPAFLRPNVSGPHRTAFFSAAGATGVMLLGGVIAGSVSLATANNLNAKFSAGTLTPADKSGYGLSRGAATTANVFFGLSALGAMTTGALFLIDPRVAGSGGDVDDRSGIAVGPTSVTIKGQF